MTDSRTKATIVQQRIKQAANRYFNVIDIAGMIKSSDGYLLSQDGENIYLEFIIKKPTGIYDAKE